LDNNLDTNSKIQIKEVDKTVNRKMDVQVANIQITILAEMALLQLQEAVQAIKSPKCKR
jgi:hypothetical protein